MKPAGESEERGGNEGQVGRQRGKREREYVRQKGQFYGRTQSVYVTVTLFDLSMKLKLCRFLRTYISKKRERGKKQLNFNHAEVPNSMHHGPQPSSEMRSEKQEGGSNGKPTAALPPCSAWMVQGRGCLILGSQWKSTWTQTTGNIVLKRTHTRVRTHIYTKPGAESETDIQALQ